MRISCFLGFYDLRLYTGNMITHHIWCYQLTPALASSHLSFPRGMGLLLARATLFSISCALVWLPHATWYLALSGSHWGDKSNFQYTGVWDESICEKSLKKSEIIWNAWKDTCTYKWGFVKSKKVRNQIKIWTLTSLNTTCDFSSFKM